MTETLEDKIGRAKISATVTVQGQNLEDILDQAFLDFRQVFGEVTFEITRVDISVGAREMAISAPPGRVILWEAEVVAEELFA